MRALDGLSTHPSSSMLKLPTRTLGYNRSDHLAVLMSLK